MTSDAALSAATTLRAIPLNAIVGRSPSNCRAEGPDDDLPRLAASLDAVKQLHPLLVSPVPNRPGKYWIDDGGRRYDAFKLLRDSGKLADDAPVVCISDDVDEGTARERSLAANIMRRDLHPVDECEAFDRLIQSQMSIEKIAADFAITTRQVRQRLKLTTLSPRVRDLWRKGAIGTEVAQAFTAARGHDEQDRLLDEVGSTSWVYHNPPEIRRRLAGDAVRDDVREARYVGIDAYVAAGGALDENLFEEHALILDPALLKRLACAKMMREGEVLMHRDGYGFCLPRDDVEAAHMWTRLKPDYTAVERRRLEELGNQTEDLNAADEIDEAEYHAALIALEVEAEAIEVRAIIRGNSEAVRATAGILLSLDHDGNLIADSGLVRPAPNPAEAAGGSHAGSETPRPKAEKPKNPIEAAATVKSVRIVLEQAILAALAAVVGRRPDLALMIAVARFGGTYSSTWMGRDGFGLSPYSREKGSDSKDPLDRINGADFDKAIGLCADIPMGDLSVAFAQIASRAIRIEPSAPLAALDPLMRALAHRGAALRAAFQQAIDHEAYFAAASKAACVAACEEMYDAALPSNGAKAEYARIATEYAKAHAWLPQPLARWAATAAVSTEAHSDEEAPKKPDQPLAEAMAADEKRQANDVGRFIDALCTRDPEARVKSSVLYEAYVADVARLGASDAITLRQFGDEITALLIEKNRLKTGIHYIGLALREGASS